MRISQENSRVDFLEDEQKVEKSYFNKDLDNFFYFENQFLDKNDVSELYDEHSQTL